MNVYGQLVKAQLENSASDPTASVVGLINYQTTTYKVTFATGSIATPLLANDQYCVFGTNATASKNIRFNRCADATLQFVTGDDTTAEGSLSTSLAQLSFKVAGYATGSLPAAGVEGRLKWDTTTHKLILDNGSTNCTVVTTTESQVLTAKDYDGGTASDTSRMTLPKAATATLTGLTRKEGTLLFDSTTKKVKFDNGTVLSEIGSTTSGKNYISFELANFVAYDDGASATPVNGTGGSPGTAIASNTTTPLRGAFDFKITVPNADSQGEGIGYAFDVDPADFSKVLKVEFSYSASANFSYANGDIKVFIYSVDGAALVAVTPNTLDGSGKFAGYFQTDATPNNSYILCFHVTTTAALGYDFYIANDLYVGPSYTVRGAVVTDWIAWTPTNSGWVDANHTNTGKWRRVGDHAEYDVKVAVTGAVTNAGLVINLPSGHVIDTSKLTYASSNMTVGYGEAVDASGAYSPINVKYDSTTSVQPTVLNASGTYLSDSAGFSATVPWTWANGDVVSFKFSVPIVGWGSNVQLSDGAETRVVAMNATRITTAQTITKDGWREVIFNSKSIDTHSAYDITTGRFLINVSGKYLVEYMLNNVMGATAAAAVYARIYIDGVTQDKGSTFTDYTANNKTIPLYGSAVLDLNAGQYISIYTYSTSQDTTIAALFSNLSITRISGPATIAMSEKVSAKYRLTSGTGNSAVTAGAIEILDYDTKIWDSHNAVTVGASWKFVAPRTDKYRASASACLAAIADGKGLSLYIYKNGAVVDLLSYIVVGASSNPVVGGSSIIDMNQGDYIDIRCENTDASNRNVGTTANLYSVTIESI